MRNPRQASDSFTIVAPFYDLLMAPVPYRDWVDYLAELWRAYDCRPQTVLDLATGTGSVALELAARGCRVTGVDRSRQMLAVARVKARKVGARVRWLRQDMASLQLAPGSFDAAVCLYDSLNYVTQVRNLERTFRGVARALRPGGLFIFDMNTPYALEREMFTQSGLVGPLRYNWVSRYNRKTRLSRVNMRFEFSGREFSELHVQRAYPARQVVRLLRSAGLALVDILAGYTRLPPGPRTDRVFYLAASL